MKLIAVRIVDHGDKKLVHGYGIRGKNRKRMWSVETADNSEKALYDAVKEAEAAREDTSKP